VEISVAEMQKLSGYLVLQTRGDGVLNYLGEDYLDKKSKLF